MKTDHSRNPAADEALHRLLELMDRLRDPHGGCAWDRKQSIRSLASHTLEEVYEVIDAIENGDDAQLQDELGDLLFQIIFYAQIGKEEGRFDFASIAEGITRKLLRRHPHIFPAGTLESFGTQGNTPGIDATQVEKNWELIKEQERAGKPVREESILDQVPVAFPALDRAKKLQKKAAGIGFDWPDVKPVLGKLHEETRELEQALASGDQNALQHEIGDLLFTCVNLARHLRIEPENALRDANRRFENRFRFLENVAKQQGIVLSESSLEQLDSLWEMAKRNEAGAS